MTQPITAIIFDFGNVLVKWDPRNLYKRFFPDLEAVDSFLEEIRFMEWNAYQDAGRSFKDGVKDLSKQFPQYKHLIEAYDKYWEDSITDTIDGTIEILNQLRESGWKLYLLTNFSAEKFEVIRNRYEFLKLFDRIIISGEYGIVKPDPAIFALTLELIGRRSRECLFIDDSPANIESARRLGFQTILFHSAEQLKADLKIYL